MDETTKALIELAGIASNIAKENAKLKAEINNLKLAASFAVIQLEGEVSPHNIENAIKLLKG